MLYIYIYIYIYIFYIYRLFYICILLRQTRMSDLSHVPFLSIFIIYNENRANITYYTMFDAKKVVSCSDLYAVTDTKNHNAFEKDTKNPNTNNPNTNDYKVI